MKPSSVASTFGRELLKDSGASGVNEFLGSCVKEGVGPAVAGLIATGGAGALGILASAALLVGPILWERHQDKKRQHELAKILTEIRAVLDLAATDAAGANRQLTEIAQRRQFVWARISGADQADFAQRVSKRVQDDVKEMLTELGEDNSALLEHIEMTKDIAYDNNFKLIGIKADTEAILARQSQIIDGNALLVSLIQPIVDDYIRRLQDEQSKNTALSRQLQAVTNDRDDLRDQLASALLEQARVELDKGRSIDDVIAELRSGNPRDLLAFLDEQVQDDDASFERERLRLIARHRERATIAYPLGEIDKAEQSLTRVLQLVPNDLDALNRLGHLRILRGDLDEAQRLYARVLDDSTDKVWQAAALGNLGMLEHTCGNLDTAEDYLKQSLAIDKALASKEGMANQLANLGLIERTRGNLDAAEDYLKQSLAIDKELASKEGMANQLANLGVIERTRGNLNAAEDYLMQSLAINKKLANKEGMAAALGNLGLIEQARGNLDAAEDYLKQSLAIERWLGRKWGMAAGLGNLGLIEHKRGNLDAAEDYQKQSLAIHKELASKEGMAADLGNLGLIEGARGNLDAAEDYHEQSLAIDKELGRKKGVALAFANLGLVEQTRGNTTESCTLWRRSLALFEQIGAQPQAAQVRSLITENCPDQPRR